MTTKPEDFADQAPVKGIPQPPKCPRYGDDWATSSAGFNVKGPDILKLTLAWPYRGPGKSDD
jgi:hypothetical protein